MQPFDPGQGTNSASHGNAKFLKNPAVQAFLGFCLTPWNEPFEAVW
jgi:hypothetical protein